MMSVCSFTGLTGNDLISSAKILNNWMCIFVFFYFLFWIRTLVQLGSDWNWKPLVQVLNLMMKHVFPSSQITEWWRTHINLSRCASVGLGFGKFIVFKGLCLYWMWFVFMVWIRLGKDWIWRVKRGWNKEQKQQ
jgi:hypothetical protein